MTKTLHTERRYMSTNNKIKQGTNHAFIDHLIYFLTTFILI